jgi:hypothetical protein
MQLHHQITFYIIIIIIFLNSITQWLLWGDTVCFSRFALDFQQFLKGLTFLIAFKYEFSVKQLISRDILYYRAMWLLFCDSSGELVLNDCKGPDDWRCCW